MNVCVLNLSGNVGKSTLARHLLAPRLAAAVVSVESVNSDGPADGEVIDRIRARKYGDLQRRLATTPNTVVDVGSSNVEEFLHLMGHFAGSHEDFDLFVVPAVSPAKQQLDTINTIRALRSIGAPGSSIRVVMNKVETSDDVLTDFEALFTFCRDGSAHIDPLSAVFSNEVFELLKKRDMTLAALDADHIDYRTVFRSAITDEERDHAISMIAMKRLAVTCQRNLDVVFSSVMPD